MVCSMSFKFNRKGSVAQNSAESKAFREYPLVSSLIEPKEEHKTASPYDTHSNSQDGYIGTSITNYLKYFEIC